jgi:ketosteroid isomerase-like protein
MKIRSIIPALVLLLLAPAAYGQTEAAIIDMDKAWVKAVLSKDVAALDRILADKLIYAHASGVIDTKKAYLTKLGSGRQVYKSLDQKIAKVELHGDTALTQSWVRVTGVNQDGPFDDKIMMMHVWLKQNGVWKLAGHQTARVDKLP